MMRRAVIESLGSPEVLRVVEADVPEPGPGEIRVKVLATGVAFADVMMRRGLYPGAPKPPFTPGYDLVGEVESSGGGLSGPAIGERVAALTQTGANAQYTLLPAGETVPVPAGVDAADAACLPLNYVTAYQMLHRVSRVEPGEKILVHGAAGGVGTALLQLGALAGLTMYGTASKGKHGLVEALGATPIDYKNEDFAGRVRTLAGDGVDAVFDPIGGENAVRSFRTLRRGGRLVVYGFSSSVTQGGGSIARSFAGQVVRMALWSALPNGRKVSLYALDRYKKRHPGRYREDLARLLDLLADGELKPVIAERLPLEEISRAHELIENAGTRGKLVLLPNEPERGAT